MSNYLKVFVYGTLKVGGRFAKKFDEVRLSTKTGTIQGTMFNINKSFPGLVLGSNTDITGEVHKYKRPEEVEKAMDMIEGFRGENDPHNLYNKAEVEVETDEGVETCKVYVFARDTADFEEVVDGVWEL